MLLEHVLQQPQIFRNVIDDEDLAARSFHLPPFSRVQMHAFQSGIAMHKMQRWESHLTLEQIFPVVSSGHAEITLQATKINFFLVSMEPCRRTKSPMDSRIHIDTSGSLGRK
jgi:hypothetical protein